MTWAVPVGDAQIHQLTADAWNDANPDRPVRVIPTSFDADGQRAQMANILDMGSPAFDILALDVMWTGEYAENGWLVSMEEHRAEVEGVALDVAFQSALWGDELWALPYSSNAGFLYYRTDLVDSPPGDLGGAPRGRARGRRPGGDQAAGCAGRAVRGLVVNFLEYYWSAGGELSNEDLTAVEWPSGDAAMTALEFMRDSFEDGFFAPGFNTSMEEEARTEFQGGNAVFMRQWPYAVSLINDDPESPANDNYDIAPLPTFTGDGTISALGGFNNAVSAFSNHPEEAIEFVMWLSTDPEVQAFLGERALPPVAEQAYEDLSDDPVMALLAKVLSEARARPPIPQWPEISDVMQRELFPAYNGDADLQDAIDAVGEFLQGVVDE